MLFFILVSVILLGIFIFQKFQNHRNYFDKHGILYMKPLPVLGNMWPALSMREPLVECLNRAYKLHEDAKYVGFFDFGTPVVVLKDLDLVKSVTVKNFDHFVNHRGFVDPEQEPLFGNNLFSLHDNKWREIRNLLSPAFTSSKMKGMFKLMSDCASNFVDFLAEKSQKKPLDINSKDAFTRYMN